MPQSPSLQKVLYSLREIGRQLDCHQRTVYRMIDDKEIKAIRIRNRWMVTHDELMHFINSRETNS